MGCRIIQGVQGGDSRGRAVFYCSTSEWAFGPVMNGYEEAEAFLEWLPGDPRGYSSVELEKRYGEFRKQYKPDDDYPEEPTKAELMEAAIDRADFQRRVNKEREMLAE